MKKIMMNKVDKDVLVEIISGRAEVSIPETVIVGSVQTGSFDRGEKGLMCWANMVVYSSDELELLTSVGLEENANELKLKLANYQNENLDNWIDKKIDVSEFEVVLVEKKGNRGTTDIVGLAFRAEIADLREIK